MPWLRVGASHCLVLTVKHVPSHRDRATAEECLKHPWLAQGSAQEPSCKLKGAPEEAQALQEGDSVPESNSDPQTPETQEPVLTEELIVVTSYTLGQCRQSEKEKMEQKAISKRFKFEEPLLQEIPGDFIYWAASPSRTWKFLLWDHYLWTSGQMVQVLKVDDQVSLIEPEMTVRLVESEKSSQI